MPPRKPGTRRTTYTHPPEIRKLLEKIAKLRHLSLVGTLTALIREEAEREGLLRRRGTKGWDGR